MSGKRRLINYRPIVLIALCALLAIAAGIFAEKFYVVIICFALIAALWFYAAAKGKYIALSVMVLLSVFSFVRAAGVFSKQTLPEGEGPLYFTCRVSERTEHYDDSVTLYCTGIKADDGQGNTYSWEDSAFTLPTANQNDALYYAKSGDRLSFYAEVKYAESAGEKTLRITALSDARITPGKSGFFEAVRSRAKDMLLNVTDVDTAALMYSILFGDKSGLSNQTYTAFQFSGLAHILAVSGLHVGMLSFSVFYLLRKAKARPWIILAVTVPVLGFYCALCSFTPSVMRASIMSAVFLTSKALRKRYDPLNSLAFSAIIVTAIDYKAILSLSFQMSYMCMLSIIVLMPVIEKLFLLKRVNKFYGRSRLTRSVCRICALSLAAQIGVLPLMINSFNYIAVYNIFANILVSPFLAVSVYLLYGAAFLSLIMPFLSFALYAPAGVFYAVKGIAYVFSYLPFAALTVIAGGALLYALYLLIVLCGRFFMCAKQVKWGVAALSVIVFITAAVSANLPLKNEPHVTAFDYGYSGDTAVIYNESAVYAGAVNSFNRTRIKEYFFGKHIRSIDILVLTEFKERDAPYVKEIVNTFKPKIVLVPDVEKVTDYGVLSDACAYSKPVPVNDSADRAEGGITVRLAIGNKKLAGLNFYVGGQNITVIYEKNYSAAQAAVNALPFNPDVLIAPPGIKGLVPHKYFIERYDYVRFSNEPRGNFTYNINTGIITYNEIP